MKWKNNLFVGSLAQQKFLRLEIDGEEVPGGTASSALETVKALKSRDDVEIQIRGDALLIRGRMSKDRGAVCDSLDAFVRRAEAVYAKTK